MDKLNGVPDAYIINALNEIRKDIRSMHQDLKANDTLCLARARDCEEKIDRAIETIDSREFKLRTIILSSVLSVCSATIVGMILHYVK